MGLNYFTDDGYHEDSEEHYGSPHVHRCVDCGGWIIQQGIDNTTCRFCTTDERARCNHCGNPVRYLATTLPCFRCGMRNGGKIHDLGGGYRHPEC